MNKLEFLERLEKLLADIPYTERREALNYYTEYFEDADKDEEEVIRTLGSPEEVAHNIREESAGKELAESATVNGEQEGGDCVNDSKAEEHNQKSRLEGWQIALIIIGVVVTVPIWGGLVSGLLGGILGIVAGIFGIILALAVVAVALFVTAVVVFVFSLTKLLVTPLGSLFSMGLSLLLLGISMLCLIASWKMITVLLPSIWKGLVYIFNSIFHKKEGVAA
ncbi:MAG: DUF1700 domain-containing protein [Lachnospiraceae bacterium]|nr:DUF1700 domain-containing protein [Lachnospiraceae bacterium]